jgi:hypothetical protein
LYLAVQNVSIAKEIAYAFKRTCKEHAISLEKRITTNELGVEKGMQKAGAVLNCSTMLDEL